jgi:hypothetical protein
VAVGNLDCALFDGNVCVIGFSLVNATVPNGGDIVTEMPVTNAFERHFVGPGASCTTLAHRAAVEVDSSRNRDLEVLFGLRGGTQLRMYDNPGGGCNGDDLDVTFKNNSGAANVCNPAPGAQISPVQSLNPLNGIALAGNSYHMTVRDTLAGSTTRFLLAGHETDLSCAGATFPSVCPGVAASVAGSAAFAESALGGVAEPHFAFTGLSACLLDGLFAVGIYYEISASQRGEATMVPLTNLLTAAYFLNAANPEVFVKVLNGCGINGNYWVFIGGLTSIRTIVTVTHMPTGFTRYYINPSGEPFLAIQDTSAFPLCNGIAD